MQEQAGFGHKREDWGCVQMPRPCGRLCKERSTLQARGLRDDVLRALRRYLSALESPSQITRILPLFQFEMSQQAGGTRVMYLVLASRPPGRREPSKG